MVGRFRVQTLNRHTGDWEMRSRMQTQDAAVRLAELLSGRGHRSRVVRSIINSFWAVILRNGKVLEYYDTYPEAEMAVQDLFKRGAPSRIESVSSPLPPELSRPWGVPV